MQGHTFLAYVFSNKETQHILIFRVGENGEKHADIDYDFSYILFTFLHLTFAVHMDFWKMLLAWAETDDFVLSSVIFFILVWLFPQLISCCGNRRTVESWGRRLESVRQGSPCPCRRAVPWQRPRLMTVVAFLPPAPRTRCGTGDTTENKKTCLTSHSHRWVMKPNRAAVLRVGLEVSSNIRWLTRKFLPLSVFNEVFNFTFSSAPNCSQSKDQIAVMDS